MSWVAKIKADFELAARKRFCTNYDWHKAVWEVFPDRNGKERCFLSRLDIVPEGFAILLLSQEQPQRPDWCPQENWNLTTIRKDFFDHRTYRFDLRANPTRKIAAFDKLGTRTKNGRRVALLKEEEQVAWLKRKGASFGFQLKDNQPVVIDPAVFHPFTKKGQSGLHLGVRFQGVLDITDRQEFVSNFYKGIGSAKAFGYGMLLIQPLMTNNFHE